MKPVKSDVLHHVCGTCGHAGPEVTKRLNGERLCDDCVEICDVCGKEHAEVMTYEHVDMLLVCDDCKAEAEENTGICRECGGGGCRKCGGRGTVWLGYAN